MDSVWPAKIYSTDGFQEVDNEAITALILKGINELAVSERSVEQPGIKWEYNRIFSLPEATERLRQMVDAAADDCKKFVNENPFLRYEQFIDINQPTGVFTIINTYSPLQRGKKGSISYTQHAMPLDKTKKEWVFSYAEIEK